MKYECENCYTCCITASSQVTYCALPSECTQSIISYSQALSFTILVTFLLTGALACLYFVFRNRALQEQNPVVPQSPLQKHISQFPVPKVSISKRNSSKVIKMNDQLQIQSRLTHKSKLQRCKPNHLSTKVTQPETERGFG